MTSPTSSALLAKHISYLVRTVTDCHGVTRKMVGPLGDYTFVSGNEGIPMTALHMEASETQREMEG